MNNMQAQDGLAQGDNKVSLDKNKIKILLLEGLHPSSVEIFKAAGYTNIEYHKGSLSEDELKVAIADAHFVGLRSRTNLSQEIFDAAKNWLLLAAFVLVPTKLISMLRPNEVFLFLMHHFQIHEVLPN